MQTKLKKYQFYEKFWGWAQDNAQEILRAGVFFNLSKQTKNLTKNLSQ